MLIARKYTASYFKLKKNELNIHELCVEKERKKETFDVMINVRSFTIYRRVTLVSCRSCKICPWEEKLSLCQAFVICSKINVLNRHRFVPREFLSFVKTESFRFCCSEHFSSSMNPQGGLLEHKLRCNQSATDRAAIYNITL